MVDMMGRDQIRILLQSVMGEQERAFKDKKRGKKKNNKTKQGKQGMFKRQHLAKLSRLCISRQALRCAVGRGSLLPTSEQVLGTRTWVA